MMVLLYFGFVLFQLSNSSEFRFTDDFKSVAFSAAYKVTGASAATRHHQLIPIVHNGKAAYMYIVTLTGKSTVTDIKVFDQEFRPVSRAILSEELLKRIETVKTDHVTGFTYFPTDSVAKLSFNIEKESFHAGMPELLLSTMLKKSSDQSVRIRNFSSDLLSYPAWLNGFTVVKRMNDLSLKIGSKTFSTTRFICSFQDSKGAQMPLPEIQYWISAEKPYLIQMMVAGMVYELAELDFQKLE